MDYKQIIEGEGFKVVRQLGKGGCGSVFLAKNDKERVAAKVVTKDSDIIREYFMLKKAKHPNIVKVTGIYTPQFLTMELADGSLDSIIRNSGLDEEKMKPLVRDVLKALAHMERKKMVHFDIKPGNIFLKKREGRTVALLGDFGFARRCSEIKYMDYTVGTERYMSEEMSSGTLSRLKRNDIYSLGVTMKEMRVGMKKSEVNTLFDKQASAELKDFVDYALKSANKRPSAKKLLKHKWFKC